MKLTPVSQVEAALLHRRLRAISEEMGLTLQRTTHSPVLHAALDFATGIYGPRGAIIEQADFIPMLAFALQPACEHICERFPEAAPGDVFIHNDVFSGGNQLADVGIYRPVFNGSELVAWVATKGHQADIGGAEAGTCNPSAREVWQEGIRIPPLRLVERGVLRDDVWEMIFANVRFPVVADDVRAQIGATAIGARALERLVERYGSDEFARSVGRLADATERMVRSEISSIPDGTYKADAIGYDDAVDPEATLRIVVTTTVSGDEISFDFTGTDPQTPGFTNAPLAATAAATLMTFLLLIDPDIPRNYGLLRPIHLHAPEGTIVNASFPAATFFGNNLGEQIGEAIMKSLAETTPGRVTAGWGREQAFRVTGTRPCDGSAFHDVLFLGTKGGTGATEGFDGHDHGGFFVSLGTVADTDYEVLELNDPVLLVKHEYAADTAGAGRWRGGLGTEMILELEGENMVGVTLGDGAEHGAFGLFGGGQGTPTSTTLTLPDGSVYVPRVKEVIPFPLPPGTQLKQLAGGGGGFGNPLERPLEDVAVDIREGFLSPKQAAKYYGVVIDPTTSSLDLGRTRACRQRAAASPRGSADS